MMVPTIHNNGTSRERLIAQLTAVTNHLEAARRAMKEATPNGRDYYPQAPGAIDKAIDEHRLRLFKLDDLAEEIGLLTARINDAEGPG